MRRTLTVFGVAFGLMVPTAATATPILFATTGGTDSALYSIDVGTGTTTLVGLTGTDRMSGLDFDSSGVLYGIAGGSAGPASLYTVNTSTGSTTLVGAVGGIQGADGLAFDAADTLYAGGWDGAGRLLTLNPATGGILTNIAMSGSGNDFVAGLDFSPTGELWGSRGNASGATEDIVLINTTTGVHTSIGPNTGIISGIWFDLNGTLYAISTTGNVLTINTTTGVQTVLFNTGVGRLSGLTGVPAVPEPASMLLLGTGLAAVAARRYRRRL